ncbi:MAG: response regulator [Sulfitobacter sp.]
MSPTEGPRNVLVVEDEWLIAVDFKMMIEEQGYQVIGPARSVAMAMDLIKENQIDAAFLDITLGTEKSFPIAEKLDGLEVPVTFVSAYGKSEIPERFQSFDLLPKPVALVFLIRQLARMLDESDKP